MNEMIEAVRWLHEKHSFKEKGGENMFFRMNLLMEEVGEICASLTKGESDIAEEHADVLIILIGNALAMGFDLETAFWRKMEKVQMYGTRVSTNYTRLISTYK